MRLSEITQLDYLKLLIMKGFHKNLPEGINLTEPKLWDLLKQDLDFTHVGLPLQFTYAELLKLYDFIEVLVEKGSLDKGAKQFLNRIRICLPQDGLFLTYVVTPALYTSILSIIGGKKPLGHAVERLNAQISEFNKNYSKTLINVDVTNESDGQIKHNIRKLQSHLHPDKNNDLIGNEDALKLYVALSTLSRLIDDENSNGLKDKKDKIGLDEKFKLDMQENLGPFEAIIKSYIKGSSMEDLKNLAFKGDGEIDLNGVREKLRSLSAIYLASTILYHAKIFASVALPIALNGPRVFFSSPFLIGITALSSVDYTNALLSCMTSIGVCSPFMDKYSYVFHHMSSANAKKKEEGIINTIKEVGAAFLSKVLVGALHNTLSARTILLASYPILPHTLSLTYCLYAGLKKEAIERAFMGDTKYYLQYSFEYKHKILHNVIPQWMTSGYISPAIKYLNRAIIFAFLNAAIIPSSTISDVYKAMNIESLLLGASFYIGGFYAIPCLRYGFSIYDKAMAERRGNEGKNKEALKKAFSEVEFKVYPADCEAGLMAVCFKVFAFRLSEYWNDKVCTLFALTTAGIWLLEPIVEGLTVPENTERKEVPFLYSDKQKEQAPNPDLLQLG